MRIIHLSDIHIGKSNNKERFDLVVTWILNNKDLHNLRVVVITGDIVDDGSLNQYMEAQAQIEKLTSEGFDVLVTPGNHNYGSNGIVESPECVDRFERFINEHNGYIYPYYQIVNDYVFIVLDSMLEEIKEREIWGAQGELGKEQLSALDQILNMKSTKKIVALHHHPFYYNYFLKLRDDELFKKVIDSRINCLLFGHKHVEKRFTEKEKKYNIDIIYASGSSTERTDNGSLVIPIIDLEDNSIEKIYI